ncbi:MAG: thioredoxin domain-containing protein [Myxococcales bacterium]
MRSPTLPFLVLALLGLFSLGASCNGGKDPGPGQTSASAAKIEKLPQVETGGLTDGERRTWVDLVNEQLSPCGDPVSVAQCVSEARSCSSCVPAARYLVRLVSEGYEKREIEELFSARFDAKKKVALDLSDSPVRGAPMAKVTIVEFSDFECPHCGAAHPVLSGILQEFDGKVNLVFKNYPLDGHKNAMPAALAAVAAGKQGKFWELADKLFEHQRELSPEKIRELAQSVGLDMAKFDADVASDAVRARVAQDKQEGARVKIEGTPTLFVDGHQYQESLQNLGKYLREELGE